MSSPTQDATSKQAVWIMDDESQNFVSMSLLDLCGCEMCESLLPEVERKMKCTRQTWEAHKARSSMPPRTAALHARCVRQPCPICGLRDITWSRPYELADIVVAKLAPSSECPSLSDSAPLPSYQNHVSTSSTTICPADTLVQCVTTIVDRHTHAHPLHSKTSDTTGKCGRLVAALHRRRTIRKEARGRRRRGKGNKQNCNRSPQ